MDDQNQTALPAVESPSMPEPVTPEPVAAPMPEQSAPAPMASEEPKAQGGGLLDKIKGMLGMGK